SFPNDEFIEPRTKDTQCSVNIEYFPYVSTYENTTSAILPTFHNSFTSEESPEFTTADDLTAIQEPDHAESADILESAEPQDNVLNGQERNTLTLSTSLVNHWLVSQTEVESEIQMLPQHMSVHMSIFSLKLNPRSSLKFWKKKYGFLP
ncbi:hypothetical protein Tco_0284279, partial [Tanacetum coccineum]